MATSLTPHPLFISHPPTTPMSRSSVAVPPPQRQSPPLQPTLVATNSSEFCSRQPVVQQNEVQSDTNKRRNVESMDWMASSLSRRFGLGAGLAWAGVLAFGVVSQQVGTRLQVPQQAAYTRDMEKTEVARLPNGIRYHELQIGRGVTPRTGDLVLVHLQGNTKDNDVKFINTFSGENKRTLALVMGSRPYTRGMCEGIEHVLMTMKAGGKRRVTIPPSLGFGGKEANFGSDIVIPPFTPLEYIVEVEMISSMAST